MGERVRRNWQLTDGAPLFFDFVTEVVAGMRSINQIAIATSADPFAARDERALLTTVGEKLVGEAMREANKPRPELSGRSSFELFLPHQAELDSFLAPFGTDLSFERRIEELFRFAFRAPTRIALDALHTRPDKPKITAREVAQLLNDQRFVQHVVNRVGFTANSVLGSVFLELEPLEFVSMKPLPHPLVEWRNVDGPVPMPFLAQDVRHALGKYMYKANNDDALDQSTTGCLGALPFDDPATGETTSAIAMTTAVLGNVIKGSIKPMHRFTIPEWAS